MANELKLRTFNEIYQTINHEANQGINEKHPLKFCHQFHVYI